MTMTDDALAPPAHYVEQLPIDLLHEADHNRHLGDLESLAASIRTMGVLEPILVRSLPTGGYEIIAGARRTAAARIAGLTTVPGLVDNTRTDEQVELARIIENIQRLDPTPLEEAAAYDRLVTHFEKTTEEVADLVGRSKSHISKRRSLLVLPDAAKAALDDGRINIQVALGITGLATDQERLDTVVDALPDVDATAEELERQRQACERTVARQLEELGRERRVEQKRRELEEAGETVVDYPPFGQWSNTEYRQIRPPEDHEAVAVNNDGQVVYLTTQPLPDERRHATVPNRPPRPKPGDDPGFVEQTRRKKVAELRAAAAPRRAAARKLLDTSDPAELTALTDYIVDEVLAAFLAADWLVADRRDTDGDVTCELLGLEPPPDHLVGAASAFDLIDTYTKSSAPHAKLRATAALVMSYYELELTIRPPRPGELVLRGDDSWGDEQARPLRRYLELLAAHGYTLNATEQAALEPAADDDTEDDDS